MTVSSSTNRVSYSGNGTLTVFAYTFKVFDEDDLTVILRASDGTETVQTITTHYTVSGVGDVGGGNITFVTAPTATQTVVILREQPLTQGLDLVPNDPFPAESLEESFDKLTFMVQQHEEELGRAIKASRTNTITTTEFVESASDRANKVIAFDGSGDLDLTQEIGTFQGDWAASTAYAVRDIVKDTNNNNIYIANTAHTSSGTVPLTGNADIAKWDLLVDAAAATTSANNAATSATAAATSATAAATSATAAATSESNAATSASNASTSETNAAASATNAATSESNAAGSESAAATSESNAATSATNASTSASAAATSATNAATSETAAAASQAAAATSETNAATSATSAATNATNAATSASNASTAQTAAETAQTAAEAAQAAAELAADNFDDTYLGSKSSDPTVDNDGGALNAGDLYFNTTSNTLKVYSGSAWQDAAVDSSGFVQTTGDTMTGDLDIQGTLTSDRLTVDAAIPTLQLNDTDGTNQFGKIRQAGPNLLITTRNNTSNGGFRVAGDNGTSETNRFNIASNGDISFYEDTGTTAKFFWDASAERLGIGTTSPQQLLHVYGNSPIIYLETSDSRGQAWQIRSTNGATAASGTLSFRDEAGNTWLDFANNGGSNQTKFYTGGTERMRIDSSGNLLVGTTDNTPYNNSAGSTADNGIALGATGIISSAKYNDATINLNRTGTDGDIAVFRKDGTAVGSIGTINGDMYEGTGAVGLRYNDGGVTIIPVNPASAGSTRDAAINIGASYGRFKDLYLSGGVYLGGTGSANKLDDYEEGTWSPRWVNASNQDIFDTAPTVNMARYTKIGDTVIASCYFNNPSSAFGNTAAYGATNAVYVGGLPFTSNRNGSGDFYGGTVSWYDNWNGWTGGIPMCYSNNNGTSITLVYPNGSSSSNIQQQYVDNTFSGIILTVCYKTTS